MFELFLEVHWGVVCSHLFCVAVPELGSSVSAEFDEASGVVVLILGDPT